MSSKLRKEQGKTGRKALKLSKETLKDLTAADKSIKGGGIKTHNFACCTLFPPSAP